MRKAELTGTAFTIQHLIIFLFIFPSFSFFFIFFLLPFLASVFLSSFLSSSFPSSLSSFPPLHFFFILSLSFLLLHFSSYFKLRHSYDFSKTSVSTIQILLLRPDIDFINCGSFVSNNKH